jgi:ribosomal protein L37AE/L43A
VSGLALGYAFVRFGLYASILLHFSINFVTSWVYEFTSEESVGFLILGMVVLLWIVAGSYFFVDYSFRFGRRLLGMDPIPKTQRAARRKVTREVPQGRGFVCPHCGNVAARYENGVLICLRCGRPATPLNVADDEKIDPENNFYKNNIKIKE